MIDLNSQYKQSSSLLCQKRIFFLFKIKNIIQFYGSKVLFFSVAYGYGLSFKWRRVSVRSPWTIHTYTHTRMRPYAHAYGHTHIHTHAPVWKELNKWVTTTTPTSITVGPRWRPRESTSRSCAVNPMSTFTVSRRELQTERTGKDTPAARWRFCEMQFKCVCWAGLGVVL